MITQPNAYADLLRGRAVENEHGDTVDTDVVVAAHVPVKLAVRAQASTRSAGNQERTAWEYTARCSTAVDVRIGDRVRVQGQPLLAVVAVTRPSLVAGQGDVRLELRART